MAVINVDQLAAQIMTEVTTYAENTIEDVTHAVKVVARATAEELQETSPVGATGDYAENWSYRRSPDKGKSFMDMVVYNKKPEYRKTHLLEHGHEAVDGSFVAARPHIAQAEEKASHWLDDMLNKPTR